MISHQNHDINKNLKIMNESSELLKYDYFSSIDKINYDDFIIYYKKLMDDAFINRIDNISQMEGQLNELTYMGLKFWQEYYYLFYLSLKIIKKYIDNSNIIGIGESPMKLIFSQYLFYEDRDIKKYLNENNYPTNLTFNYLPISGLSKPSYQTNSKYYNNSFYEAKNKDSIIDMNISLLDRNLSKEKINDYLLYLEKLKYDPRTIIESRQSKFIFVDRGETFNTTKTFLYLYKRIFLLQYGSENNEDKLQIFISKFKLITFDGNYDDSKFLESNIDLIKRFCIKLFKTSTIFEHYLINLHTQDTNYENMMAKLDKNNIIKKLAPRFNSQFIIPHNVINFISLPEKIYLNTRCIKSIKLDELQNNIVYNLRYNIKDKKEGSKNCNLSNLVIFIIFNKLKDDKTLLKLIKNLNFVKESKLSVLNENSLNLELLNDIKLDIDSFKKIMINSNDDIINKNSYNIEYDIPEDEDIVKNKKKRYFDKYIKYKNKYLKLKGGISISN